MTIEQFVNKYNGTTIGTGQCPELIKQYENDVLGLIPHSCGNAVDYYNNFYNIPFLYENFTRYNISEKNIQIGDIVVWNTNVGGSYGHIDIAYKNITNTEFIGFDQNWNIPLTCSIENHTYNNILGYLRFKGSPPIKNSKNKWLKSRNFKIQINY